MTARDQARAAAQRFGVDRHDPVDPGPSLPDRLTAARERKGVDLVRAERETKIRVRYLSALESGRSALALAEPPSPGESTGHARAWA